MQPNIPDILRAHEQQIKTLEKRLDDLYTLIAIKHTNGEIALNPTRHFREKRTHTILQTLMLEHLHKKPDYACHMGKVLGMYTNLTKSIIDELLVLNSIEIDHVDPYRGSIQITYYKIKETKQNGKNPN